MQVMVEQALLCFTLMFPFGQEGASAASAKEAAAVAERAAKVAAEADKVCQGEFV